MPHDDRILETAALIALVRRGGRAWHQFAELVEARGSALAVLRKPDADDAATPTLFPPDAGPEPEVVSLKAIADEVRQWLEHVRPVPHGRGGHDEGLRA